MYRSTDHHQQQHKDCRDVPQDAQQFYVEQVTCLGFRRSGDNRRGFGSAH